MHGWGWEVFLGNTWPVSDQVSTCSLLFYLFFNALFVIDNAWQHESLRGGIPLHWCLLGLVLINNGRVGWRRFAETLLVLSQEYGTRRRVIVLHPYNLSLDLLRLFHQRWQILLWRMIVDLDWLVPLLSLRITMVPPIVLHHRRFATIGLVAFNCCCRGTSHDQRPIVEIIAVVYRLFTGPQGALIALEVTRSVRCFDARGSTVTPSPQRFEL